MAFLSEKLISASATEETDDDFNLVTGLYKFDGSNGAQNNTFLDSSSESHTVTRNADVAQGTFSPFSAEEGKWAVNFPVGETTTKLTLSSSSDFAFGTSAFTVEAWVFVTADTNPYSRIWQIGPYFNDNNSVGLAVDDTANSSKISFWAYAATGTGRTCISTNATPRNEWFHVAVTRDSTGDFRLFVNGNLDSTNTSYRTTNISPSGNQTFAIGNIVETNSTLEAEACFEGFISNLRVVNGTALYSSSFTPSTSPLTAVTNTKLLTCCSNRFRDKSTSAHTITTGNLPRIQPFSPFAPSEGYSTSSQGGAGFFDGTSDCYLTVSDATDFDFGTGDYTIEAWFYPTANGSSFTLPFAIEGGNNYWGWTNYGSGYNGLTNHTDTLDSSSGADSESPDKFGWNHIVYQVTSGTNNWYKNGVQVYSGTAATHADAATGFRVGRSPSYNNHYYGGYISDVRIVKGSNVYSNASTLTVPTAPLTSVTNTKLLLNFTNAAMFDQSGKAIMENYGNVALNTSVKKFGTASVYFDGTSTQQIQIRNTIPFGTGPFTVEFFMKTNTSSQSGVAYRRLFKTGVTPVATNIMEIFINSHNGTGYGTTTNLTIYTGATSLIGTTAVADNNWHHVAVTRDTSNNLRLFVDGSQSGSTTASYTNDLNTDDFMLGRYRGDGLQGGEYLGYIDELRITLKARYTSNFTAPTKEFESR